MQGSLYMRRHDSPEQLTLVRRMTGELSRPEIKTVSFRMEETLVLSPFPAPSDLFPLMEDEFSMLYTGKKDFPELRTSAELTARRSGTLTLERIYSIMERSAKLTPAVRDRLLKRECELVRYFAFPRKCGSKLFAAARNAGKRIVIISDSLYPRSVVVSVLERCGYRHFDELIVTSELGSDVDVLEEVMKRTSSAPRQLMHIGGSVEDDVEAAVMKGSRSMLLSPVYQLMVRSGRLRGYAESQHKYDFDSPEFFSLRSIFGLYAAYAFDTPQNKLPQTDFCGDPYMLGFIVLGPLSLLPDFAPEEELHLHILQALRRNEKCDAGAEDFAALFESHFADFLKGMGYADCQLPFTFFVNFAAPADRQLIEGQLSPEDFVLWGGTSYEPDLAPIHTRRVKKSALSKLADRLFPPGTKVRTIVDGILLKMHR